MNSDSQPVDLSGVKPSKSEQTRAVILDVAATLFYEQGYNAATLRKIAGQAGLEAGSIYYHFGTKDEILDQVLDIGVRQIYDAVVEALEHCRARDASFKETFSAMVHAHLTLLLDGNDFAAANIRNFSMLPPQMRERHRPLRRAYADTWDNFLGMALAAGDIRSDIKIVPLRQFVLGALNWTVEWYDAKRHPVGILSERVTRLILNGMSTSPRTAIAGKMDRIEQLADLDGSDASKAMRTRAQILSAAAQTMRRRGFGAATMRDIAVEAGVEPGSIYYHFESKDDILDEVLDRGLRDMLGGVSKVLSVEQHYPNHQSRIAAAVRAHMMYLFALSEFTSANIRLYGQLSKDVRARHRPVRRAYAGLWDKCLSDAQKAGEIRPDIQVVPLRQFMLGALNWTVEWFDPGRGGQEGFYTLAEMIQMLPTLLLFGIARRKKARG